MVTVVLLDTFDNCPIDRDVRYCFARVMFNLFSSSERAPLRMCPSKTACRNHNEPVSTTRRHFDSVLDQAISMFEIVSNIFEDI